MYSIGEITKMANISRRTLHYYNEIGLLQPTKVESNQYRYYDDAALMKLQKILLLKSLGLTLEQIKAVFDKTGQANSENESWIESLEEQIQWIQREKDLLDWKQYLLKTTVHAIRMSGKIEAAEIVRLIQALQARELEDGWVRPIFSQEHYTEEELEILSGLPVLGSLDPRAEHYARLISSVRENMHEPPDSPKAQQLAGQLYELALGFFQGDARLLDKYWGQLFPEEGEQSAVYGHDRELMAYIEEMIGHYLQAREEERQ
ncbi:HTH-type transcriptional activator tipA [Chlamydia abortus]|uniref:MerR family transcriptional regulator n=1 Tax=Paenibacillus sp. SAFN-117 TaxID=3436860 RepID=UPI000A27AAB5|nr:HTH-type transcriptional activator tipA [Chlamydia abortus]